MFEFIAHNTKKSLGKELDKLYEELQPSNAPFIKTITQKAMFVAQLAHETGQFRWIQELGGKSYFKKYNGRKDLGNNATDGYKYRGRGLIMITGRYNYHKYGKLLGFDLLNYPSMATQLEIALLIAFKYWEEKKIDLYTDNTKKVTRLINGGSNGLKERQEFFEKLLKEYTK